MTIYESITNRILKQLENGVIPWRKTWSTGLPKSLTTGKEYRGVNLLVLGCAQYTSRYWITYREALRLGGYVRKGEHATPVIYWKWRTPAELERLQQKTGKDNLAPCVPFTSVVFNLEQVDGVERPNDDLPLDRSARIALADSMLEVMPDKPEIVHTVTSQPAYCPATDRITLPHLSQFESADAYYGTLYHELIHATGAPRRLNRFQDAQRDEPEKYSMEELVAEFGAAFLCGFAGLQNPAREAQEASYIEGWARVLKKDNRLIVHAASAAQRAADYIRGKTFAREEVAVAA